MRHVVVGAGIIGLSIAYALTQQGVRDLKVVTKGGPGDGASGVSGGAFRIWHDKSLLTEWAILAQQTINLWRQTGFDVPFQQVGLRWVHESSQLSLIRDTLSGHGVAFREEPFKWGGNSLLELESGYFHAKLMIETLTAQLLVKGVEFITECEVYGIKSNGDRTVDLQTRKGTLTADSVVLASGADSYVLMSDVVRVPRSVQYAYVLEVDANHFSNPEVVINLPENLMVVPREGTAIVAFAGPLGINDHPLNAEQKAQFTKEALDAVFKVFGIGIERAYACLEGVYDNTLDELPIVGPVPGMEGVYAACGFNGVGFKFAPFIGEAVAQELVNRVEHTALQDVRAHRY